MDSFAVIDFETTGLSPRFDRVIEVGVALVRDNVVVDTFATLMNPGVSIPYDVVRLTGITPAMLRGKPAPERVMPELQRFIGNHPCVAHNASFDQRFLEAEMTRASVHCQPRFFCSMLLSRRLVQGATRHTLGELIRHLRLTPPAGLRAHRALDDTLMTAELWRYLMRRIAEHLPGYQPDADFVARLSRVSTAKVDAFLHRCAEKRCAVA
jgi:DNA polymerase III subunit epsilon